MSPELGGSSLAGTQYLQEFKRKVEEEKGFNEATKRLIPNEETAEKLRVVTKEGFVFEITDSEVNYIGKQGDDVDNPPTLEEANIKFKQDIEKFTKSPVHVEITTTASDEFELQYTTGDPSVESSWKTYTKSIEMKTNGYIYARLINKLEIAGDYATHNVLNIDIKAPTDLKLTIEESTTHSITVKGEAKDVGDDTSGASGISKFYFKTSETGWLPEGGAIPSQDGTATYEIPNLAQNKTHKIYMKVVDNVTNEAETKEAVEGTTEIVPSGGQGGINSGIITFSSNTGDTNQTIDVTIDTTASSEYKLEYIINNPEGKEWTQIGRGSAMKMEYCGLIFARLKDSTGQVGDYATYNVANIDKKAPTNLKAEIIGQTSNSMTVKGSAVDEGDAKNKATGISKIYFSTDGTTWLPRDGATANADGIATYTIPNLNQKENYNIYIKAVDKVTNEAYTANSAIEGTTGAVPGGNSNKVIKFSHDTKDTNKSVVVTISTEEDTSEYRIQWTEGDPTSSSTIWNTITSGQTMTKEYNGAVYARLIDSRDQKGEYETHNVTCIDKQEPTNLTATVIDETTNSLIVQGNAIDPETERGKSTGIGKYEFSADGSIWFTGDSNGIATIPNLIQNQEYTIQMKATDKVGNTAASTQELTGKTDPMPNGGDTVNGQPVIAFSYSPDSWTNREVTITMINNAGDEYRIEYTTGDPNGAYTEGNSTTRTENGPVYARLKDSTGQVGSYATGNVTIIDTIPPTAKLEYDPNKISKTIAVTGKGTDEASGIGKYTFQYKEISSETWSDAQSYTTANTSQAYTYNLAAGKTYHIRVKVTDVAGNVAYSDGSDSSGNNGNPPSVKTTCPEGEHQWSWSVDVAATCTSGGRDNGTCTVCGEKTTRTTNQLGHSYTVYKSTKSATCTSGGYDTYKCSRCSSTTTKNPTDSLGHSYTVYQGTSATCTSPGYDTYKCSRCSDTTSYYSSSLGHSYTRYVSTTSATCTSGGYDTYRCSRCSSTTTKNSTKSLGHSYTVYKSTKAATCTSGGYDTYQCSRCSSTTTKNSTSSLGHSYTVYKSTTATCTSSGKDTYQCSRCSATTTKNANALGHSYTVKQSTKAATCTSGGYDTYKCSRCSSTTTKNSTNALGHSYTVKQSTTAATCTAKGYDTYKCSRCSSTTTKNETAALGHNMKTTTETCGLSLGRTQSNGNFCEGCGKFTMYIAWYTCVKHGTMGTEKSCSCGYSNTWGSLGSCTSSVTVTKCSRCGASG